MNKKEILKKLKKNLEREEKMFRYTEEELQTREDRVIFLKGTIELIEKGLS